ncbi:MAG: RNA polymerase sigma factor SigJ [Pseudonocardiaceae bacterium]
MTDRERLLGELRPVAFAIAYRLLGSVAEAEDVVQEALLRMHQTLDAGGQIASPRAFVATVTTRLAINELRSARARRERYVGEWLPEPIITDGHDDPARHAQTADSLSLAMLVLLESLSPEQRAVLLLHDVFDYGYPEIAAIVGKSQDNVRQLATRARRHVEQRRPRFHTTREQRDELARRFFAAAEQGDLAGLEALLAHDVELTGDDGGKVPALARSLRGRNRVARTLINWIRLAARLPGVSLRPVEVNGGPGALYLDGQQRLIGVLALDIAGGQITSISSIVNPDKLTHLEPVAAATPPDGRDEAARRHTSDTRSARRSSPVQAGRVRHTGAAPWASGGTLGRNAPIVNNAMTAILLVAEHSAQRRLRCRLPLGPVPRDGTHLPRRTRRPSRRVGRPVAHPADKIEYARLLKGQGPASARPKPGILKTSLHRYLYQVPTGTPSCIE